MDAVLNSTSNDALDATLNNITAPLATIICYNILDATSDAIP